MGDYPVVQMDTDTLLTTTRSVRRRLDFNRPAPLGLIRECLTIAIQAPTSANRQHWSFVVIQDPVKRRQIGAIYKRQWDWLASSPYAVAGRFADDPARAPEQRKASDGGAYLAEHLADVPALVLPCIEVEGDTALPLADQADTWGSIMPAAWNFMLAAHTRGLGTAWTSLTTRVNDEIRAIVGYPDNVYHATLLPVAYYTGTTFRPGKRVPLDDIVHIDAW
ncbi:nitroreductase family protein [Mycobacterium paraterrae]|uniref:Nitroreductase family protein n=1 Tax=Mycobacterium paraterrae TaxID=577492 RepID=A0ABY3VT07_9MYCO|nr:nitroreductase family protein [Mycobacterium paraterrae]UMB69740.1 nitroreductase family protein [Mycobacterium paraterrae]